MLVHNVTLWFAKIGTATNQPLDPPPSSEEHNMRKLVETNSRKKILEVRFRVKAKIISIPKA